MDGMDGSTLTASLRNSASTCRTVLSAALVLAVLSVLAGPAAAGPWQASSAQGLRLGIAQDSHRTRDAYLLERRYPDGVLDASFGQQGSVLFSLGPDNEGPTALRLDTLGRPWVAGASVGQGDTELAVVLRFLQHGAADLSWADGGRSATAPAGQRARALDLAPQADGSVFVVGTVTSRQGLERTGWWRLRPDGRVDPAFGLGGLWQDAGSGSTEVVDLVAGADGSLALDLRRGGGASLQAEAWVLQPGAPAPALVARATAQTGLRLVLQGGAWRFVPAPGVLAAQSASAPPAAGATVGQAASAASAAAAGPAAAPHPAVQPAAAAPAAGPPAVSAMAWAGPLVGVLVLVLVLMLVLGLGAWRRRLIKRAGRPARH